MNLDTIDEIIQRIRKKPIKNFLLLISLFVIFCVSVYLKSYISERAKPKVPNLTMIDNGISNVPPPKLNTAKPKVPDPTIKTSGMPIDINQTNNYTDVTDSIIFNIRSERFGKKMQFKFPKDMKIWAAKKMIVMNLDLPDNIAIPELGIDIKFDYILSIDSSGSLNNNNTLIEAGIQNRPDLKLNANILIVDPELEEAKKIELIQFNSKLGGHRYWFHLSIKKEIHQFLEKKYSELEIPFEFDTNVDEEIYQFLKNKYLEYKKRAKSDPELWDSWLEVEKNAYLAYLKRFQHYDKDKENFTK